MCGIIGYTGERPAKDILLDALEVLEYRGYDSSGVAVCGKEEMKAVICKCAGRVKDLRTHCERESLDGTCGIGHTRWATHGNVSDANAHPHRFGKVTVVHNGIIENDRELIQKYGFQNRLLSQTDSEVAAAVLDHFYDGDVLTAIWKTVSKLKGTFALGIMFEDVPGVIYAVRNVSPVVMAETEEGMLLASDLTPLSGYSKEYYVLPEFHVAELRRDGITVYDSSGEEVELERQTIDWDLDCADKGGYPFYMEKEIMEQPKVLEDTILPRVKRDIPDFSAEQVPDELFSGCKNIVIVACGTAMYAGLVAQALIQGLVKIPVVVQPASEFLYTDPLVSQETLVIAISQSGETIDTLEALKYARRQGARSLAIVNVRDTAIARESEYVLYTNAGPEIAVASTKAYTTQLAMLYLVCMRLACARGCIGAEQAKALTRELLRVPGAVRELLERKEEIHHMARGVLNARDVFMIGRGLDYSVLLEGALKLKEISYIHSEAYASGELKHGTIALITERTPVIAVMTQTRLRTKELSNIREVQSRGADVILFTRKEDLDAGVGICEKVVTLPALSDEFMMIPAAVALQLFAYYVSLDKGLDVDKPRNLAKVVTVE